MITETVVTAALVGLSAALGAVRILGKRWIEARAQYSFDARRDLQRASDELQFERLRSDLAKDLESHRQQLQAIAEGARLEY
jgi:hypothetical protein